VTDPDADEAPRLTLQPRVVLVREEHTKDDGRALTIYRFERSDTE
jgi:hypothetical protein